LDNRREIQIDPKTRTYSIGTFDEIRARDKAANEQFPSHITQDLNLRVTSTGKTPTLLDHCTGHKGRDKSQLDAVSDDRFLDRSLSGRLQRSKQVLCAAASAVRSGTDASRFPAVGGVAELMMATEASLNSLAVWPAVMSKVFPRTLENNGLWRDADENENPIR
jgi:hypothetical protein